MKYLIESGKGWGKLKARVEIKDEDLYKDWPSKDIITEIVKKTIEEKHPKKLGYLISVKPEQGEEIYFLSTDIVGQMGLLKEEKK